MTPLKVGLGIARANKKCAHRRSLSRACPCQGSSQLNGAMQLAQAGNLRCAATPRGGEFAIVTAWSVGRLGIGKQNVSQQCVARMRFLFRPCTVSIRHQVRQAARGRRRPGLTHGGRPSVAGDDDETRAITTPASPRTGCWLMERWVCPGLQGVAATNAHHPYHFREHCRSGRQRLRRELSAAGRQRHRFHQY